MLFGQPVCSPTPPFFVFLVESVFPAQANRANVPWIVVGSHFPLYAGKFEDKGFANASLSW